jgi:hypothetical protein
MERQLKWKPKKYFAHSRTFADCLYGTHGNEKFENLQAHMQRGALRFEAGVCEEGMVLSVLTCGLSRRTSRSCTVLLCIRAWVFFSYTSHNIS